MPKLLDLFCGAGGASMGYYNAGFKVTGIDISPQKNYPFEFIQENALQILNNIEFISQFDVIHASPPCQAYSNLKSKLTKPYPKLIKQVRELLIKVNKPYIVENVPGSPLINPILLCGTMFEKLRVIRHRLFESNIYLQAPFHEPKHPLVFTYDKRAKHYGKLNQNTDFIQVTGGGNSSLINAKEAMGINWQITKSQINQAIPPAYTEYISKQLINYLNNKSSI